LDLWRIYTFIAIDTLETACGSNIVLTYLLRQEPSGYSPDSPQYTQLSQPYMPAHRKSSYHDPYIWGPATLQTPTITSVCTRCSQQITYMPAVSRVISLEFYLSSKDNITPACCLQGVSCYKSIYTSQVQLTRTKHNIMHPLSVFVLYNYPKEYKIQKKYTNNAQTLDIIIYIYIYILDLFFRYPYL
jgi:hypothetical protein